MATAAPTPPTPARTTPVAAARNIAVQSTLSGKREKTFGALVKDLTVHGDCVGMSDFLKAVKEPRRHTKRYLDGKTPSKVWKLNGKLPRLQKDWKMLKGQHGGGTGDGLPHARVSFLKAVWAEYYSTRV